MENSVLYTIALTLVPGIGPVHARNLIQHFHEPEAVFKASIRKLKKIDGIGSVLAEQIKAFKNFEKAEKELAFIQGHDIQIISIQNENYPQRLRHCYDAPILMYYKGNLDLNASKMIAVIGTRRPTNYGKDICKQFIHELPNDVVIISGLATGVDSIAHEAALESGKSTVAVLGHGLDRVYPAHNRLLAKKIVEQGGLLTDFPSETNPDRENFPRRNRIVAGMCDAVIVMESGVKGGSMITAECAIQYNRDVFAFPGRTIDYYSAGCNELIRTAKAQLVQNAKEFLFWMNWENTTNLPPPQISLFPEFTPEEKALIQLLIERERHIEELFATGLSLAQISSHLLQLEMQGWIRSMPGNRYGLVRPLSL